MYFESDDYVLEYCEDEFNFWFLKQTQWKMSTAERVKLAGVQAGKSIEERECPDTTARANEELCAIHRLVQLYLG